MNFYALIGVLVLILGCDSKSHESEISYIREKGEAVEGIRIAWDFSTMQKLAPQGERFVNWAGYPRVRKLKDSTLMAVYDVDGNGEMIRSTDKGKTWSTPVITFKKHQFTNKNGESTTVNIANSELCQLQNGDLIMACNYRPATDAIAPFAIVLRRSSDNGQTWSDDQILFEAGNRFIDGCWEPSILQLPNGELQIYFANEASFTTSNEQNISMLSSADNGRSWSNEVKMVAYRADRRDGMPVALLVDDEILVSIEDNNIEQFKPYIIRTTVSDKWSTPVLASSPHREYALKDHLPDFVYAGAPYIMRVPTGEVILSYQTTSGRSSNWENSTCEVAVGDNKGRNFEKLTRPLNVPLDREAKWNSISLWDENTIVAASTTSFQNKNCEVWIICGHIIPVMQSVNKTINVDGMISTPEWGDNFPVFVGHKSATNLKAALCSDNENLYVGVDVKDAKLFADPHDPLKADGITLYLDAGNYQLLNPDSGIFKIWSNYKGETKIYEGNKGNWQEIQTDKVLAKVKSTVDAGYQIEFNVPFSVLKKQDKSDIRVNIGLFEYNSLTSFYEENIANANTLQSNTWLSVSLN